MEGDDAADPEKVEGVRISIHSLRMEGDAITKIDEAVLEYFNPLPPHGGRLPRAHATSAFSEFQSTPSAWRETASC